MNALRTAVDVAASWPVVLTMLSLVAGLGAGAPAGAYDYFPLEIGTVWYYRNDLGEADLVSIVREEELLGAMTRVRLCQGSQIIENYWSVDTGGHVYLHGGRNFTYPFELAYLPPLRMVDAPLYVGKEWVTENVRLYDFQGHYQGEEFDYPLQVYSEGDLVVPAGTFHTYGIGYDPQPVLIRSPSGDAYDLLLHRVDPSGTQGREDGTDFYSDGVGLVQYIVTTPPETWFKLQWWNPPTPPQESTWGKIKALFR